MNVLLVTGSCSLGVDAIAALDEILLPLIRAASLVVAGDARGPDARAIELAQSVDKRTQRWCLGGHVTQSKPIGDGLHTYSQQLRWWDSSLPRPRSDVWPLIRNQEMVRHVVSMRSGIEALRPLHYDGPGYEARVLCVGFVDPESRTHGTDHTLTLARQAGIWTARYEWDGGRFVL